MQHRAVILNAGLLLAFSMIASGQSKIKQTVPLHRDISQVKINQKELTDPLKSISTLNQLPTFQEPPFTFYAIPDKNQVLLFWTEVKNTSGYHLYSKTSGQNYVHVNATTILPVTDCQTIRKYIVAASPESLAVSKNLDCAPCEIQDVPSDLSQDGQTIWRHIRSTLAQTYYKIGIVMGQAYLDKSAKSGTIYYKLTAVVADAETTLVIDRKVIAGIPVLLQAPGNLSATAGDEQIFLSWDTLQDAVGYDVYRAEKKGGSYSKVNSAPVKANYTVDPVTMDSLIITAGTGMPGYLDTACQNDTSYFYKITGIDMLNRQGKESAVLKVIPRDLTPPATPKDMTATPQYGKKYGLRITWPRITLDEKDRMEQVAGYNLYRYSSYDQAIKDSVGLMGFKVNKKLIPQPKDSTVMKITGDSMGQLTITKETVAANVHFEEYYPTIQPNTVYWYRIQCLDKAVLGANKSKLSAAIFGSFQDTIPPKPPIDLYTDAYEDSIVLSWKPPATSTDGQPLTDLAGFDVYRGICGCERVYTFVNLLTGKTVETAEDKAPVTQLSVVLSRPVDEWTLVKKECRPYNLGHIANIDSAKIYKYTDRGLPKGSPVCYRYAIKAYDKNQNYSVMSDSICDRLGDHTGPLSPILTGLNARDKAVLVQWITPPVQDLFGFIVERSESGSDPWIQVSPKLKFPAQITCQEISASNIWQADSVFSFIDTTVTEKKTYWYRVAGADYNSNFGQPSVPIETYTYNFSGPPRPTIVSVLQSQQPCGLDVVWTPDYHTDYLGFAVFRSSSKGCCFRQISPIVKGSHYIDEWVVEGQTYWYKVQYFDTDGNRSSVSDEKSGKVSP
jgi:fibronectin type 3 domain-containing protein